MNGFGSSGYLYWSLDLSAVCGSRTGKPDLKGNGSMTNPDRAALVEQWMAMVRSKGRGRTRYDGQPPYRDEAVLAHIEALRAELDELQENYEEERGRLDRLLQLLERPDLDLAHTLARDAEAERDELAKPSAPSRKRAMSEWREPKVIYLQPWCQRCESTVQGDTGRLWCVDDVWGKCEECEKRSVCYVRDDE